MSDIEDRALVAQTKLALMGVPVNEIKWFGTLDWLWYEAYRRKGGALETHEFETMAGITQDEWQKGREAK